jgi:hypothetical protein
MGMKERNEMLGNTCLVQNTKQNCLDALRLTPRRRCCRGRRSSFLLHASAAARSSDQWEDHALANQARSRVACGPFDQSRGQEFHCRVVVWWGEWIACVARPIFRKPMKMVAAVFVPGIKVCTLPNQQHKCLHARVLMARRRSGVCPLLERASRLAPFSSRASIIRELFL